MDRTDTRVAVATGCSPGRCEITAAALAHDAGHFCVGLVLAKLRTAGFPVRPSVWDAALELPKAVEVELVQEALQACRARQFVWWRESDRTVYAWQ